MQLDMIHDIQSTYRKVLNTMSRPGIIENLCTEALKVDINVTCYNSTFLVMIMLLDREVSFNIVSKNSESLSNLISQMTYAEAKPVEEADYIFVLRDECDQCLGEVIQNAKIGDLIDPNKSASIIAEFDNFNGFDEKTEDNLKLLFKGPGIKEVQEVNISGNTHWINKRREKNEEYPLGIDLICIDKNENVLSIPRTTHIDIE